MLLKNAPKFQHLINFTKKRILKCEEWKEEFKLPDVVFFSIGMLESKTTVEVVTSGIEYFLTSVGLLGCPPSLIFASATTGEDNSIADAGRVTTIALKPDRSAAKTTGFVFTGGGTFVFFD